MTMFFSLIIIWVEVNAKINKYVGKSGLNWNQDQFGLFPSYTIYVMWSDN